MSLLGRYVLGDVLRLFLLTVVSLTLFLLITIVGKQALDHGLGAGPLLQLMPFMVPKALLFALPATLLFAITSVFGRMSSSGEIIALKSLGISPRAILLPVGVLAVLLSLATFYLNDLAFSWGDQGAKRVVMDAFEEIAYRLLRTQKSFRSPQFSAVVQRVEGRKLISANFTLHPTNGSSAITLMAEEAELRSNPGSGVLLLTCHNVTIEVDGTTLYADSLERKIQFFDPTRDPNEGESPSHIPLRDLPALAVRQKAQIEKLEDEVAAHSAYTLAVGNFGQLCGPQASASLDRVKQARVQLCKMQTEPPRRWANGFSCLCFAMVGAPMAILRRYSDTWATFFVCFLPTLLLYYPLMMFGVDRAKMGAMPPSIVWLGNIVFALWGLWLLRRVYRY